ncbi:T4 RnlA family RNA ligase [Mycobacteroides abscessus]|uniref:T4 RnlA family RNA ligase n=1 Tax=Mycobacteroides abscessus TaxID=36809 RepID=UPI0012FFF8A6|nr:T4 RnlA family RNA ligase [Mycobacteroides abscessus]
MKLGLVRSQTNTVGTLTIYVYTEFTQYERLWNSVTRQCRGLVVDNNSRVVIRCLPKFFNSDEPEALLEKPRIVDPTTVVVQDKLDGSLIQVANDHEYGLVITSKGSFNSDQAKWARQIIAECWYEFDPGLTYIFELIHPDNRIVIDYGSRRELVLLAVVENETGVERDIYTNRFEVFNRVAKLNRAYAIEEDINFLTDDGLVEGIVVNFGGYRVKVKTDEYLRLHRIVTDFTPKRVWEALSNGDSLEFENMPEEFQAWLDETKSSFEEAFAELDLAIKREFERAENLTDKELGLAEGYQYKGFVFMLRNNKDAHPGMWKLLKPKKEVIDA